MSKDAQFTKKTLSFVTQSCCLGSNFLPFNPSPDGFLERMTIIIIVLYNRTHLNFKSSLCHF